MKKFRIIAMCDPYNADFHYRGQEVKEYNGATPVAWVMADNLTEEEAVATLRDFAYEDLGSCDNVAYEYDEWINEMKGEMLEDGAPAEEVERAFSWYEGAGFYEEKRSVWLEGEMSYRNDVMYYSIEEA
jgi:hypothetical protein